MNIRGHDGIIREFLPPQIGFSFTAIKRSGNHTRELDNGSPAYCNHCRESFGFNPLMEQKESLRSHACDKIYNQQNNEDRLNKSPNKY